MDEKTIQRFWAKVDKDGPVPPHCPELGPCWVWTASRRSGYGAFKVGGKMRGAHRVSWQIENGPIPGCGDHHGTMSIMHGCDNPACVRPTHLSAGAHIANMADRSAKGRQARCGGLRSSLTEGWVAEIHSRYAAGGVSQSSLAAEFGVTPAHISQVLGGKRWAHMAPT